jgi:preprotein translocase subunit YajC
MLISPAYAQAGGAAGGDFFVSLMPLILIFVVFYFLLIRPQQKKVKQHRDMVAALRRGDRIVTAGGIIGTVAKVVNETEVLVEIAEGVRVRLVRAQVSEVLTKTGPTAPTPANKADNEEAAAVAAPEAGTSTGKKISGLFGRKS